MISQNNGGNMFGRASTIQDQFMAESDFDAVSHAELAQSIVERPMTMQEMPAKKVSHEIATGSDDVMTHTISIDHSYSSSYTIDIDLRQYQSAT